MTRTLQTEVWVGFWDTPISQGWGGELSQAECSTQELYPKSREWLRGEPGVKSLGKRKSGTSSVQFLCSWEGKKFAEGFEWGVLASLHLQPAVLHTSGTGLAAAGGNLSPASHYCRKHWWVCVTSCLPQAPGAPDWAALNETAWRGEVGKKSLITPLVCSWTRADVIKSWVIS